MKTFSSIRAKRSTAFVVRVAWLFALASGVANACLLEEHGKRDLGTPVASHEPALATALSDDHAETVAAGAGAGADTSADDDAAARGAIDGAAHARR